ncbi:mitochondrial processing peptidase beta subunit [Culex quinquefasciatus]|uniref:Mitochondrial processing peptidase beta subunit n=1 Tax=Culex quinquefasciatus TaxID=7176 RepID=B0XDQ1_CULQU|nr:mitochondrial processing peptidase beta subunit [Culex quinquefasciatus]|eukprot:XP_001867773.1 mitochondrial processing peptidase beta subunit [Culex quinquefasciatus]
MAWRAKFSSSRASIVWTPLLTDVTAKLVDSVVFVLAAVVRVGVFRRLKWSVQVGLGVNPFQEDFQGRCGHRLDRSVYLLGDQSTRCINFCCIDFRDIHKSFFLPHRSAPAPIRGLRLHRVFADGLLMQFHESGSLSCAGRFSRQTRAETECERVMQEVESKLPEVIFDHLNATACQGIPLGNTILGPTKNIQLIDKAVLQAYTNSHFKNNDPLMVANMLISAWYGTQGGGVKTPRTTCALASRKRNRPVGHLLYVRSAQVLGHGVPPAERVDTSGTMVTHSEVDHIENLLKTNMLLQLDGTTPIFEDIGCQMLCDNSRIPRQYIFDCCSAIAPIENLFNYMRIRSSM